MFAENDLVLLPEGDAAKHCLLVVHDGLFTKTVADANLGRMLQVAVHSAPLVLRDLPHVLFFQNGLQSLLGQGRNLTSSEVVGNGVGVAVQLVELFVLLSKVLGFDFLELFVLKIGFFWSEAKVL